MGKAVILGRKIGMSQIFDESGRFHPITVVEAGPCFVVQVKTKEIDGYEAVKIGYETQRKKHRSAKAQPSQSPRISWANVAGASGFMWVIVDFRAFLVTLELSISRIQGRKRVGVMAARFCFSSHA